MDDEELNTWLVLVIQKVNNRPLILGAPQGITITPNHILHGLRNTHGNEINKRLLCNNSSTDGTSVELLFGSGIWIQEFTRRQFLVLWKEQGLAPQLRDIVLFRNEPCYKHKLSTARIIDLPPSSTGERLEDGLSLSTETCVIYIRS